MTKKYLLIFLFSFFFLPIFYFFTTLSIGFFSLKKIEGSLENKKYQNLERETNWCQNSLKYANNFWLFSESIFEVIGLGQRTRSVGKLLAITQTSCESLGLTLSAARSGNIIFSNFIKGEKSNLDEAFREPRLDLAATAEKTAFVQSLLNDFSGKEFFFGNVITKLKKDYPRLRLLILESQELVKITPEILGKDGRRTYLILFQNNMELRPTGGFIGSYGLLTLDRGALIDFVVSDVYAADGQLRGYVEPPSKLAEFLGQTNWYLRDSNWDPDFPTSGAQAEWFLEKETGRRVDGTIAVDLFVAQRLLEVFGEIELVDYNEKVSADNFFERAQFHNEVGFFPGSTAKSDFLGAVATELFEKIKIGSEDDLIKLGLSFYKSLKEKDILISLHNQNAMQAVSKFNWDGGLKDVKHPGDYLMVVEANVGVNKVNYFLSRSLKLDINITKSGEIENALTITYENKSPSEIFPGGRYKNYLRLYVNPGSTLLKCKNGNEECQIEETIDHKKSVFGFLVEVPAGERRRVEISWLLPEIFEGGKYNLFIQKQSGTKSDALALAFSYPERWRATAKTGEFYSSGLAKVGSFTYNTDLSQDKSFEFEFQSLGN